MRWLSLLALALAGCATAPSRDVPLTPLEGSACGLPTPTELGVEVECAGRHLTFSVLADLPSPDGLVKELASLTRQGKKVTDEKTVQLAKDVPALQLRFRDEAGGPLKGLTYLVALPADRENVQIFMCESRGESLTGTERCLDDLRAMQSLKLAARHVSYRARAILKTLLTTEAVLPADCVAEDHLKEGFSRVTCGKTFLLAVPRTPFPVENLVHEADALEGRLQRTGATQVQRVGQKCAPASGPLACARWWVTLPDSSHLDVVLARVEVEGQPYLLTYYWNNPTPETQLFFTRLLGLGG